MAVRRTVGAVEHTGRLTGTARPRDEPALKTGALPRPIEAAVQRLWATKLFDPALTLIGIYAVHYLFVGLFVRGHVTVLTQPFQDLPAYIYLGWDGDWYRRLYQAYDRFAFPPLYPFTLRLITFVFQFHDAAFEKSAVILNFVCHAVIVWGTAAYTRDDPRLKGIAPWLVAFLILFYPGHNVFFAAYSESLYLAVTIGAFILHKKGRLGWASAVAGASALVRTMGCFLALALFLEQLFYCLRDRQLHSRRLLLCSGGLLIILSWNLYLRSFGTDMTTVSATWQGDLVERWVTPGMNPHVWVFKFVAYWVPKQALAFWASMIAIVYCAVKKRYAEMFYLGLFNVSLVFYLYRPFPWTRYVSVLFPIQIMLADWLKNKPRLTAVVLMAMIGLCYYVQVKLFMGSMGEP